MTNKRRKQMEKRLEKNKGLRDKYYTANNDNQSASSESSCGESLHDDESVHDDEVDLKVGDKVIAPATTSSQSVFSHYYCFI